MNDNHIISTLMDDIGHWGLPEGQRCRSMGMMLDLVFDESRPLWVRDTAIYAVMAIAPNDPAVIEVAEKAALQRDMSVN